MTEQQKIQWLDIRHVMDSDGLHCYTIHSNTTGRDVCTLGVDEVLELAAWIDVHRAELEQQYAEGMILTAQLWEQNIAQHSRDAQED